MYLPNASMIDRNQILEKVEQYCLSTEHEYGKHKALLFQRLLGISQTNSEILLDAIFSASQTNQAFFVKTTPYCDIYNIVFSLTTDVSTCRIRTGWCVKHETQVPHLSTAYID
jgi:hypothetical protein